jgi:hypothetical protein
MNEVEELVPLHVIADMWRFHFGDDWVKETTVMEDPFFYEYLPKLFSEGFLERQVVFYRFLEIDVYRIKLDANSR